MKAHSVLPHMGRERLPDCSGDTGAQRRIGFAQERRNRANLEHKLNSLMHIRCAAQAEFCLVRLAAHVREASSFKNASYTTRVGKRKWSRCT